MKVGNLKKWRNKAISLVVFAFLIPVLRIVFFEDFLLLRPQNRLVLKEDAFRNRTTPNHVGPEWALNLSLAVAGDGFHDLLEDLRIPKDSIPLDPQRGEQISQRLGRLGEERDGPPSSVPLVRRE